ncbi:MAG: exodeoxyribonuclease V subunit alpha [Kiritimatiellia bacterium]|jgi:exodeoxyribonuclease V alpha subunit|nr:exodeoxyribonuclease V subunit alpha [Kiritimatiellia bacterium]
MPATAPPCHLRNLSAAFPVCDRLDPYARHFADAVCRLAPNGQGNAPEVVWLAAALTAQNTVARKHVCLTLGPGLCLADLLPPESIAVDLPANGDPLSARLDDLAEALRGKDCAFAVTVDPPPGAVPHAPLVLEQDRLYLQRYWLDENTLAAHLNARASEAPRPDSDLAEPQTLTRLNLDDAQRAAIRKALANRLCVITGGPGTGKTTLVSVVLAALLREDPRRIIRVCAPTGKAQARLKEALDEEINRHLRLEHDADLRQRLLALETATLHRLLRARPPLGRFAFHASNPLAADALIVDEVSMIDLPLMVGLLNAVPPACNVILLGDSDQLAAVETGAALAEMCAAWEGTRVVARLTRSHRFDPGRGIGRLKDAVRAGDADRAWEILTTGDDALGRAVSPVRYADLEASLASHLRDHPVRAYLTAATPAEAFARFDAFRILCATRHGPCGVDAVNRCVQARFGVTPYEHGYPVMVTVNDYSRNLFNGDIGLCLRDPQRNGVRVWFPDPAPSGSAAEAPCPPARAFRSFATADLPAHEPVFAMTVHKAQGSGFDEVLLLLPPHPTPVLTRELLYTGITRARARCTVWADELIFKDAVRQRTRRMSGLRHKLLQPAARLDG